VIRVRGNSGVEEDGVGVMRLNGEVPIPLVMVHETGDAVSPFAAAQEFRRLADAAGHGGNLVQQAVRRSSHCRFYRGEADHGLVDLLRWVQYGDVPTGEDFLGPLDDIGREYTEVTFAEE